MVTQAILESAGYKEMLADAMEDLWEDAFGAETASLREEVAKKEGELELVRSKMSNLGSIEALKAKEKD